MSIFDGVDWARVRDHYDGRLKAHRNLVELYENRSPVQFARAALGEGDPAGNYSAAEHGLGFKILDINRDAETRIFKLAGGFIALDDARSVPEMIYGADLDYLKIGVGSEISCLVNPGVCWVANTRTIWTHLVIKHADNVARAEEELELYRDPDATVKAEYRKWSAIHRELDHSLTRVAERGHDLATEAGIRPGELRYLWADAIATHLYSIHHRS